MGVDLHAAIRRAAWSGLFALLGLLPDARSATAPADRTVEATVVLVRMEACCAEDAWPEAEDRALVELGSLGLSAEEVDGQARTEQEQRLELAAVADARGAVAAFRVVRASADAGGVVDLWLVDRVTGKTTFRTIGVLDTADPDAASVAALRVVELLRASLLELQLPGQVRQEVEPPPRIVEMMQEVTAPEPAPELSVGIAVGPVLAGSPGGVGLLPALELAVRWNVLETLALAVAGSVTLVGGTVEDAGSSCTVNLGGFRLAAFWEPWTAGWFRPAFGLGAGMRFAWSNGTPAPGYVARFDWEPYADVGAEIQALFVLAQRVGIRAGFRTGVLIPELSVRFGDRTVATAGRPLLEGFVGLETRL
jgi:hypothetical protein